MKREHHGGAQEQQEQDLPQWQQQGLAKCIMILGTTSGCGKSLLVTGLCRYFARKGIRVAPFKAQNMSNNARVVNGLRGGDVGEIGAAQYVQAAAACIDPDVRMNPILLKPEKDGCDVIVLGKAATHELKGVPWTEWGEKLWPHAKQALLSLRQDVELVVIEGMGSPAEINLKDWANMNVAAEAEAACLLVTDIERGGAFAHLLGTWMLMHEHHRRLVRGFVINKFGGSGGMEVLRKGTDELERLTSIPTAAVLPMLDHGIPDEDSITPSTAARGGDAFRIAVVAYPFMSNADEFEPLRHSKGVDLTWAREPRDVAGADLVVLPGSKCTAADLAWLRIVGLDKTIIKMATSSSLHHTSPITGKEGPTALEKKKAATRILGICGGLQMLGRSIDNDSVEGGGVVSGLGLLPLATKMEPEKVLRRVKVRCGPMLAHDDDNDDGWNCLGGVMANGYEIHRGRTVVSSCADADDDDGDVKGCCHAFMWDDASGSAVGWQRGITAGTYVHGLFESDPFRLAVTGDASGIRADEVFDRLAEAVREHFDPSFEALLGVAFPDRSK